MLFLRVFGSPGKCQDPVSSQELHLELEEPGGARCEPRIHPLHFSAAALASPKGPGFEGTSVIPAPMPLLLADRPPGAGPAWSLVRVVVSGPLVTGA